MSPKSNLRRSPDGRVVGSPKRQTVSFFWFSRVIRAWFLIAGLKRSHRGTEVISSSPALGKKLCLQGTNRAHFRPRCSATKPELIRVLTVCSPEHVTTRAVTIVKHQER
jgi:hypothetical protein